MTAAGALRGPQATSSPRAARTTWGVAVALGLACWLGALGRAGIAFAPLATLPKAVVVLGKGLATGALVVAAFRAANSDAKRLLASAIAIIWAADLVLALGHAQLSANRGPEWGWLSCVTYFGGLSMIVRGLIVDPPLPTRGAD